MTTFWHTKILLFLGIIATTGLVSCTSSDSSDSSSTSALSLTGTLSTSASGSSKPGHKLEDSVSSLTVDYSIYRVVCATQTSPPVTATASIASDGSFTISITGAENKPISCSLVDANDDKVADFLITDSSAPDMNGADGVSNTATFSGNAALGTIAFDPNSGEATIPKSRLASTIVDSTPTAAQVYDPSGEWTIRAVDFTLPKGIEGPCVGSCDGPPAGQNIYIKLWKGTQGADPVFALQLWESHAAFTTCGSKLGLTAQIKSDLNLDFTSYGAADNEFTFASVVNPGGGGPFTDMLAAAGHENDEVNLDVDHWKMDTAESQYDYMNCSSHDVTLGGTTYKAWRCGPDDSATPLYQINIGGG
jgi:hypothetical protein